MDSVSQHLQERREADADKFQKLPLYQLQVVQVSLQVENIFILYGIMKAFDTIDYALLDMIYKRKYRKLISKICFVTIFFDTDIN